MPERIEAVLFDLGRVLVDWGVRKKDRILSTHVLFRSKVVAMGVSLATALLRGQLTGYSSVHEFEAARQRAVDEDRS